MTDNSEKIAMRVSRNSIYGNLLISIAKFLAGVIGHSSAMISDAIHSASDVFSTIVVMIGVKSRIKTISTAMNDWKVWLL